MELKGKDVDVQLIDKRCTKLRKCFGEPNIWYW